jgi:hypothetical protein
MAWLESGEELPEYLPLISEADCAVVERLGGQLTRSQLAQLKVEAWAQYRHDRRATAARRSFLREQTDRQQAQKLLAKGVSLATARKLLNLSDEETCLAAVSWYNYVRHSYKRGTVAYLKGELTDPQTVAAMDIVEVHKLLHITAPIPSRVIQQPGVLVFAQLISLLLNSRRASRKRTG